MPAQHFNKMTDENATILTCLTAISPKKSRKNLLLLDVNIVAFSSVILLKCCEWEELLHLATCLSKSIW